MAAVEVTTQAQLDKALKDRKPGDVIVCLGGTWDKPLTASGSATVEASKYVAIHKHGVTPQITGGVIINVPDPDTLTPADWCDYYGVTVTRGQALLYKAVDDDYSTSHARPAGIFYTAGAKVVAPDWDTVPECGNGLHCSPRPFLARDYNAIATRYVQVRCKVADMVVIGDKVKVPALTVVGECDIDGDPVT